MNDVIEVKGLRVDGHHGALAHEQDEPQPFEVDLIVETDFSASIGTDDLSQTVDYAHLVAVAKDFVAFRRFALLETLASEIAAALLCDERIHAVTVAVRKLRAPVLAEVSSVGVRLTRSRSDVTDATA
jgi:dihydroneopterin aldolase